MNKPGTGRQSEGNKGAENPDTSALDVDGVNDLSIRTPDTDRDGGVDNRGRKADNLGISRQPEGDRGVEDRDIGVPDTNGADDPGTCTLDVDGDKGVDDLGGGVDNPDGEVENSGTGLR